MFKVNSISPSTMGYNGFTNMVAQSQEDADYIISSFETYLKAGYCADVALDKAFIDNKVNEEDLTIFDRERIKRKVEAATNCSYNYNWR